MVNLILGSRTYQPMTDVAMEMTEGAYSFGSSDVALEAERLGAKRKPLETTRSTLLDLAGQVDHHVVLFVATDPVTKLPTQGMVQIQKLLDDRGIAFRVVHAPFPAKVCEAITELRHDVRKVVGIGDERRKERALTKALISAGVVKGLVDDYDARLQESMTFEVGDQALDDKWIRWLRCYEALSDALRGAERVFTEVNV